MKNDIAPKVSLRVKFFLICMAEFIAVVLLSELAGWLLRRWLTPWAAPPGSASTLRRWR